MTEGSNQKAGEIERDIVQTQNSISDTVERLKEKLTPQSLLDAVLGDEKQSVDKIVSLAKSNPWAVALIATGAAWLASGKEPSMPSFGNSDKGRSGGDSTHRSYVDHMARLEMRDGETPQQFQQRRDRARSDYFMIERSHEEDEPTFRKRLDEASEGLRNKTAAFGSQVKEQSHDLKARLSDDAGKAKEQARAATEKAKQLYRDNAVIGGLVAIAAGALAGTAFPTTRLEQDKLGDIGDSARDAVGEQKHKLMGQAEKTLGKVEGKLDRSAS